MNPYEILGVDRNANEKTIKAAYRKLARKWHPDLLRTDEERKDAEIKMKEINEAFDILKTPEIRSAFDAENPVSANVYEYYANKQTKAKPNRKKTQDSTDIEKQKQRKAVLQFLDVEYEHKSEILDMFAELATGAVNDAFSDEEYLEYLSLVLEEMQDCIAKIQKIVSVAKAKQIKGLDANFKQAQEVIEELTRKGNETPKSLKQAHYVEETRILTEKVHGLMQGFRDRVNSVTSFVLINKTWEFDDDSQLNSVREKHKNEVMELLSDMQCVQKTASERNIDIGVIAFGNPNSRYSSHRNEKTLDECREMVEKNKQVLDLNLQKLREEFWAKKCSYSKDSKGRTILKKILDAEEYKGNFICPPNISGIASNAFYWLRKVCSITIPDNTINIDTAIEVPKGSLKKLIFTFDTQSKTVNISRIDSEVITRKGDYICVSAKYSGRTFALVDTKKVYVYDEKKLCKLNGVNSMEQLEELSQLWKPYSGWKGYQLQIHTWAQVVKKLPEPNLMRLLPISVESVKEWVKMDKTNLENAILVDDDDLKTRVVRLYIALGALNGSYCHAQAECLISKLDVSKMYRSRLERFPNEKQINEDPMFSVPRSAVDLVQENINNKDFLPYVFAFLEGYKLFQAEAKKANVELSVEFIINTASQYIFHKKVEKTTTFVKQLLETEKDIDERIADKILRIYNIAQRQLRNGIKKNVIETVDTDDSSTMHYKFLDIESLQSYCALATGFKYKSFENRYYGVEAENVFVSSNSHAIEIMDGENKRVAIAILNLFDKGELFADIMSCENKSIEVLETIRRALIDQKNCNDAVTGISIGMNEAPRTSRYNEWRKVVQNSSVDWAKKVIWTKFEYLFKSRILGDAYKAYRVRFMVDGKKQYFDSPNPWDNPKKRRRRDWY